MSTTLGCFKCSELAPGHPCPNSNIDATSWKSDFNKYSETQVSTPLSSASETCSVIVGSKPTSPPPPESSWPCHANHVIVAVSSLPCHPCYVVLAMSVLSYQTCHIILAMSYLSCQSCHVSLAMSSLPCHCCHARVGQDLPPGLCVPSHLHQQCLHQQARHQHCQEVPGPRQPDESKYTKPKLITLWSSLSPCLKNITTMTSWYLYLPSAAPPPAATGAGTQRPITRPSAPQTPRTTPLSSPLLEPLFLASLCSSAASSFASSTFGGQKKKKMQRYLHFTVVLNVCHDHKF